MCKAIYFLVGQFVLSIAAVSGPALAVDPAPPATQPAAGDQATLEENFARTMSNAVLAGNFTLEGANTPPKEDRYSLGVVKKLEGDLWLFNARIQYGKHDVTIPLIVPVKWAGDTPVISVTNLGIPGIGSFTARVVIYDDHYAGTWSGSATHRGSMFGKIEHPATTQPAH